MDEPGFEAYFSAVPRGIATVRADVAAVARDGGLDADTVAAVRLAVSEAATNAVLHGYAGRDGGVLYVAARFHHHRFEVVVCDEGRGDAPPPDAEQVGLGLKALHGLTSDLEIVSDGAGTEVRMAFDCPG